MTLGINKIKKLLQECYVHILLKYLHHPCKIIHLTKINFQNLASSDNFIHHHKHNLSHLSLRSVCKPQKQISHRRDRRIHISILPLFMYHLSYSIIIIHQQCLCYYYVVDLFNTLNIHTFHHNIISYLFYPISHVSIL